MQLDPACAGGEAAASLLERRFVQVEPQERDQPTLRARGVLERAVVGGAERRMPVRLVEAEHERARDAVARHQRLELVVVADHAVDVVPQVEMHVEDVGAFGQDPRKLAVPLLHELQRACLRVHPSNPS